MSITNEQAIEACQHLASMQKSALINFVPEAGSELAHAAKLLTRDGKLREMMEKLIAAWKHEGGLPSDICLVIHAIKMVEIEAALKEESNG